MADVSNNQNFPTIECDCGQLVWAESDYLICPTCGTTLLDGRGVREDDLSDQRSRY